MSDNNFKLVTLVLCFPIFINCMTISVKDSITYDSDSKFIKLSNDFIIESTLKITLNDSIIDPTYINPTEGKIFLNNVPELNTQNRDSCRRFISLIDMLYENKCSIVILASKPITSLNSIKSLSEEFKRTASRLYEMTIVQPTK